MSKNKALIVGATGIVGLNLVNLLKEQAGWAVASIGAFIARIGSSAMQSATR